MNDRVRTRRPRDASLTLLLLVGSLLGGATVAQDSNREAKEAAQALGSAGQAAARAVASDTEPALERTRLRGHGSWRRADHTATGDGDGCSRSARWPIRMTLGGAVGRTFVVEGTLSRPDVELSATDPEIQRGDTVQNTPDSPVWRADSLASGSVRECGADLDDAGAGGRCGGVTYCVGAGCERVDTPANTAIRARGRAAQHGDGDGRR